MRPAKTFAVPNTHEAALNRRMRHKSLIRRPLPLLATLAPIWMTACGPKGPALRILGHQVEPTKAAVYMEVADDSSGNGPGCSGLGHRSYEHFSLVSMSCGEDCIIRDNGRGIYGAPLLGIVAASPGVRRVDVTIHDASRNENRSGSMEIDFVEVDHVRVMHEPALDPGTTAPMLQGFTPVWCADGVAADGRLIPLLDISRPLWSASPGTFYDYAEKKWFGDHPLACWQFTLTAPGLASVRFQAAGKDYEPTMEVVAPEDISEIHLHDATLTHLPDDRVRPNTWVTVDADENPYGPERSWLIYEEHTSEWNPLVVRLVTKDGRNARGGADKFRFDGNAFEPWVTSSGVFHFPLHEEWPAATCLRAEIGGAKLQIPVYLAEQDPNVIPNPCLTTPDPDGMGGAGGAGGEGSAGSDS